MGGGEARGSAGIRPRPGFRVFLLQWVAMGGLSAEGFGLNFALRSSWMCGEWIVRGKNGKSFGRRCQPSS